MAKKKKKGIPKYVGSIEDGFACIPAEMFQNRNFLELTNAAKVFLICCYAHKYTPACSHCLYYTLQEYWHSIGKTFAEIDLKVQVYGNKRAGIDATFFVMPSKHSEKYGFSKQQASKLMQQLIKHGFVRLIYQGKHMRKPNVYEFICDWQG